MKLCLLIVKAFFIKKNMIIKPKISPLYLYFKNFESINNTFENTFDNQLLYDNGICNKYFTKTSFTDKDLESKKLITLSPGGVRGFYMLGVCHFLKENYNITNRDDIIFSGASAGAWNSLIMVYNGNTTNFIQGIFNLNFKNASSILDWELIIRDYVINYYTLDDFNFNKMFVSITTISFIKDFSIFKLNTEIYSDFNSLLDCLDCCITSSHIPFVTGGLVHFYKKRLGYDGGFIREPYVKNVPIILNITPSMWYSENFIFNDMLKINNTNIEQLYIDGYKDSLNNKDYLDTIFL